MTAISDLATARGVVYDWGQTGDEVTITIDGIVCGALEDFTTGEADDKVQVQLSVKQ